MRCSRSPVQTPAEPGEFEGPILFCIRMAHYSSGEAGWFSARTLSFHHCSLASGCMWSWFADSISALVGFIRALRFPPTPKNRNPFIFLVDSSGLSLCKQTLFGCLRLNYLCVCCGYHTGVPWEPSWLEVARYKTANYYYSLLCWEIL